MAIDDGYALIGAEGRSDSGNNSGTAYVFAHDGVSWVQQAKLHPSAQSSGALFGLSVAVSTTNGVVGAQYGRNASGTRTGSASFYKGLSDCNLNLGLDLCDVSVDGLADTNLDGFSG